MKKRVMMLALMIAAGISGNTMKAQNYMSDEERTEPSKEQGLFNRLAIGVSASTMGIGIDAATTLNHYLMLRAGVDIMPGFKINTDLDVDIPDIDDASSYNNRSVEVEGGLGRTQGSLLLNIYPFRRSSFFITGGAYFGGQKLVKVQGQSEEMRELYQQYGDQAGLIIGDYKLPIDKEGRVAGGIKVNGFRPYVGLGFGRAVPHNRVGFMFELGVQFHGTPKLYSDTGKIDDLLKSVDAEDDFSEIMDKLNIYPVIKFRLCGRIF